ncbi:MAG: xanthine dehydrogenase family protein [Clostridia bacterium]|nr:xanthine dehydrogenase family protein [Clostridia bacterium]
MPLYGEKQSRFNTINRSKPRLDGFDKVTGRARFGADFHLPGMLYGGVLRSGRSSARVVKIDTSKALAIPGVWAVLTAKDLDKPVAWSWFCYMTDQVRYAGDVVAIIAAESKELIWRAQQAIEVEYEDLPGVYTLEEALAEGAPVIHEKHPKNIMEDSRYSIRKGDVEEGFRQADVILEREYVTQYAEHAYIEPEAVIAYEDPLDGVMTVIAPVQNPFFTRNYIADALGVKIADVRFRQATVGGSFGGKEESTGLTVGRAAMLARATGRPVKMVLSREDSMLQSAKRHPFKLRYRAGVTKDGKIVAWEGTQIDNSGAYNCQTQFMNPRANTHSAGAYDIDNISTDTYGVYTNNIFSGAFRGYSSPQLLFGQEQFIDELAEAIGMDEVEFRRINCLKDGGRNATGSVLNNVILQEVMDYTVEQTDYQKKRALYKAQTDTEKRRGIGMAISHRGCGLGAESPDASAAMIIAQMDGSVIINSGLAEVGQGLKTAFAQIVAETLGIPYEEIRFPNTDTHNIQDSGITAASRGTVMGSQSMKRAAEKLNLIMRQNAIELHMFANPNDIAGANGIPVEQIQGLPFTAEMLTIQDGFVFHPDYPAYRIPFSIVCKASKWTGKQMSCMEWFIPESCIQDHATGQGTAFPNYAYCCVIAEVEVDLRTGYVDVKNVTASHDVGTAINPSLISGQIYGGIVMGQGYGVTEEVEISKGRVRNQNFDEYIIPTALDMPEMQVNIFECDAGEGTYGSKSIGEPATEAVAAAIANAVYNATGKRVRENPASLERVLLGKALR